MSSDISNLLMSLGLTTTCVAVSITSALVTRPAVYDPGKKSVMVQGLEPG